MFLCIGCVCKLVVCCLVYTHFSRFIVCLNQTIKNDNKVFFFFLSFFCFVLFVLFFFVLFVLFFFLSPFLFFFFFFTLFYNFFDVGVGLVWNVLFCGVGVFLEEVN